MHTRDKTIRLRRAPGRVDYRNGECAEMTRFEQAVTTFLCKRGYRVFPPRPTPEPGSVWATTRGGHALRCVRRGSEVVVTYAESDCAQMGEPLRTCTPDSWVRWVQRRRAVQVTG